MTFKKDASLFFWLIILTGLLIILGYYTIPQTIQGTNSLVINEFVAFNHTGLRDEDGDYSDWIEIYNPTQTSLNLAGWALTDDPNLSTKWKFPDINLESQAYLVVFASGKDRRPIEAQAALHTNFKLDKEGEILALYNILDDKMEIVATSRPPQFQDISYGRQGNRASFGYLATATPGQPNDSKLRWQGITSEVQFSIDRGFYESPIQLELSTETSDATIYYTLDGSLPTASNAFIYSQPFLINQTTYVRAIALKPTYRSSNVATHSYIFLDEVLRQPANPPGFPETWGVYRESYKVAVEGEPAPADYEMDPKIVNDVRYKKTIKDGLESIPSISIVLDMADFDIYSNPRERGREWERPVSVEFIDPASYGQGFQVNAGLRIQGDIGRQEYIPKHSFRLFFRNEYGAGKLEYPMFPDSPVETFDTLILRGGVQSSYVSVWTPRRRDATYTRDEWLRASQIEMSGTGAHGTFVHLYLNGLYWGLYNLVERPDETFGEAYFGVDKDSWYAFNHDGLVNGSPEEIEQLFYDFIYAADPVQKYQVIEPMLDTTAFANYLILNWYAGTGDWPENNWYAGMKKSDGRLRYFIWDGELTWRDGASLHLGKPNPSGYLWPNTVRLFFEALIQNPDFKVKLADRLYEHLFNDGALTDANAQARWLQLNQQIERAIVGETARWGDTREDSPLNQDDWLTAVENVRQQMQGNANRLIEQAREAGYYPNIDPPNFEKQNYGDHFTLSLTGSGIDGKAKSNYAIYFTTNGTDPRMSGTDVTAPEAKVYKQPLVLTETTRIKARALIVDASSDKETSWSALQDKIFSPDSYERGLLVTEIMYNPPGQDDYEFIELQNRSQQALDIVGITFEGIRFTFPADSPRLAPGQFIVLVHNRADFANRYPDVPIFGQYEGQLSNEGEIISLKDRHGNILFSIVYDDENGWPISPNGRGDSLVLTDIAGDLNDPKNWRASINRYGSPGTDDIASFEFVIR